MVAEAGLVGATSPPQMQNKYSDSSSRFATFAAGASTGQAYTCSVADFTRLLSRIYPEVNSPPQTLHRQPGDTVCGITATPCGSARLALTSSLLHSGHCL